MSIGGTLDQTGEGLSAFSNKELPPKYTHTTHAPMTERVSQLGQVQEKAEGPESNYGELGRDTHVC